MTLLYVTSFVVVLIIIIESLIAVRNEQRLLDRGGTIPSGDLFGLMSLTYPFAYVLMGWEGTSRLESAAPGTDLWGPGRAWYLGGLAVFVAAKVLKYWAIGSLGRRWTYRIMVLPGAPLITAGPYRHLAHPNYIAIIGEMAGTAMMMGAAVTGPITTVVFGLILLARIRFEDRVLEAIRRGPSS
jgi:methyltransferase